MTSYAGETITLKTSATQIDDSRTPILDADVSSTEIRIFRVSDDVEVLTSTPMVWDATDSEWRYSWTTTEAGKFEAKLRLVGPTFDTWEYAKVSIKADRFV
jgi:hypothetical protein